MLTWTFMDPRGDPAMLIGEKGTFRVPSWSKLIHFLLKISRQEKNWNWTLGSRYIILLMLHYIVIRNKTMNINLINPALKPVRYIFLPDPLLPCISHITHCQYYHLPHPPHLCTQGHIFPHQVLHPPLPLIIHPATPYTA